MTSERVEGIRVARCPSCDDHGGHGREWSVWIGDVRLVHGIFRSEGDAIVTALAQAERALASKIGPDWREALPYETEIELATALRDKEADLARVRAALEKCERALRTLDREPDWLTLADEARAALEGRG